MSKELTQAPRVVEGEILLPGEPDHTGQEFMMMPGAEAYTLGVFEDYVVTQLLALSQLIGSDHFYSGFENDVFWMQEDYPDPECNCGFDQKEHAWQVEHRHAKTCALTIADKAIEDEEGIGNESIGYEFVKCTCGVETQFEEWQRANHHHEKCPVVVPRFRCGDIEFDWYKHIGRMMRVNRPVTRRELYAAFERCLESLR